MLEEEAGARAIVYLKQKRGLLDAFSAEIEEEQVAGRREKSDNRNIHKGMTVERQAGERMARAVASATFSRQLQKMSDRSAEAVEMCLDGLKHLAGTYNAERMENEDFDPKKAKVADSTFVKVSGLLLGFYRDTQTRFTKTLTSEGGTEVEQMTDEELAEFVGIAPQQPQLVDTTEVTGKKE